MIQRPGLITIGDYEQRVASGEFDQLEDRVELIRGELRFMSPAGPYHGDIIFFLNEWTVEAGRAYGYGAWPQQGVKFAELLSIPEPDVAWVKRRRYKRGLPTRDDIGLVIEVADSSLRYDRREKKPLYAEAGIGEYWIVNCEDECIEVHRQPAGDEYLDCFIVQPGQPLTPLVGPHALLDIAALFADE
jgi:Uma2 family endonuclease